jgi:DNA invertase Pin-like site-specific DNA recombinase
MRTPAVLYAAKSTQDKKASIPKQLKDGRKMAADADWDVIGGPGVGEFKDEKFSAFSGNRGPGLKAAVEAAERAAERTGKVCMLVCQHSDRFARGAGDRPGAADSLIEIWHRTRRRNVHLRSFQNDVMLSKSVLVAVASEQAHEESKRKSEAVADGMLRRREKGLAMGGRKRFAYFFQDGDLVLKGHMLPIVDRMYDEFIAGRSDSAIMRDLLKEGIPTAEGGRWHEATVREILTNPIHKGWLQTKEGTIRGQHKPCVSEEKWQQAQDLRAARSKVSQGRGRRTSGKHLFRKGTLRCGGCGGAMVPRTIRPGSKRPTKKVGENYSCYERSRDSSLCAMTPVKRADVDTAVFNYFEQVALDVEATREHVAEVRDRRLSEVRALSEQATSEQHRAEDRLARVRRDYMDDSISAEDWASFRDELTSELEAAKAEVERLGTQQAEVKEWADWLDAEKATMAKLAELRATVAGEVSGGRDLDAVRAQLTRLFDHFIVRRVQPGDRVHAELAWVGGLILEPVVRDESIEGDTGIRPVFRREPFYDAGETIEGSLSSCPARPPPTGSRTPTTRSPRSTPRPT